MTPTGPQGQKRQADAIGCVVHVMKFATGEVSENLQPEKAIRSVPARRAGGKARAKKLTAERRSEIGRGRRG